MNATRAILAIVGSIVTLSILSVVLSSKADTSQVIGSASSGLGTLITDAESAING